MKTLLIIRHAKSSWDNALVKDIDRPLNERGRRDAPAMARRLLQSGVGIDLFVSSPAKRAKSTAELIIREFGRSEKEILFVPELYHASVQVFNETVARLDDRKGSVALFSHNPGITAFVNSLGTIRVDNMPTCGIFAVKSQVASWSEFAAKPAEFWFFDYPKALPGSHGATAGD
ncbi:MAG TPA: histidine phosphatase family protein [Puia sp.]|nr:histidine phosphatase family protein [Puia sp.]